jgi:hypothetical protein
MRWHPDGAQAMLNLRATYLNGDWDSFWAYGSDPFRSAHSAIPVVVVSACLSRWFQRPAL